jgi:uncharacterized protein
LKFRPAKEEVEMASNASGPAAQPAKPPITPPFTEETARAKVQPAQDAWNTRDPDKVALADTEDSDWRNRNEFLRGRGEIKAFLRRNSSKELDCRLKKTMWCHNGNRIAVTFEYEWHDDSGQCTARTATSSGNSMTIA